MMATREGTRFLKHQKPKSRMAVGVGWAETWTGGCDSDGEGHRGW